MIGRRYNRTSLTSPHPHLPPDSLSCRAAEQNSKDTIERVKREVMQQHEVYNKLLHNDPIRDEENHYALRFFKSRVSNGGGVFKKHKRPMMLLENQIK